MYGHRIPRRKARAKISCGFFIPRWRARRAARSLLRGNGATFRIYLERRYFFAGREAYQELVKQCYSALPFPPNFKAWEASRDQHQTRKPRRTPQAPARHVRSGTPPLRRTSTKTIRPKDELRRDGTARHRTRRGEGGMAKTTSEVTAERRPNATTKATKSRANSYECPSASTCDGGTRRKRVLQILLPCPQLVNQSESFTVNEASTFGFDQVIDDLHHITFGLRLLDSFVR